MNNSNDFETLLEEHLKTAYATAYYLTRKHEDAEDLLQEAAVQAFRSFGTFERGTNFKAWFGRVVHTTFLGRCRREGRRPQTVEVENDDELETLYLFNRTKEAGMHGKGHGDPAGTFMNRLDGQQIAAALHALPDEYRVVATLFFVEEFSYEQIAVIVECPLNTVRSRLHRSRRLLQKSLWQLAQELGIATENAGDEPDKYSRKKSRGLTSFFLLIMLQFQTATMPAGCGLRHRETHRTGGHPTYLHA